MIDHNTKRYKRAYQSKTYQDKIYDRLNNNCIRCKILKGQLTDNDCDNNSLLSFLKLLQTKNQTEQ